MIPNIDENIWEHSQKVRELYRRRAHGLEEMDASAQCAAIVCPFIQQYTSPPILLDVGCGSGYLWHSFKKRGLTVDYFGLDYSPSLIEIGREVLPQYGLPAERLICGAIEDIHDQVYDLVTMLNTLTFCPDYRESLDRLLSTGPKVMVIRDNFGSETIRRWEVDGYLDPGYNHLKAYWNQWRTDEVAGFLASYGYEISMLEDRRTGGRMELVVGKPYYWSWLLAVKK